MKALAATKTKSSPTTRRAPLLWRNTYTKRLVTFHAVRHPLGGQLPLHLLHRRLGCFLEGFCCQSRIVATFFKQSQPSPSISITIAAIYQKTSAHQRPPSNRFPPPLPRDNKLGQLLPCRLKGTS